MPKEIVLYQGLHDWSAESLINALNESMGEEVVLRVNSPGGGVFASWGIFAKVYEHGNVTIKVDGMAASGAFNLLFYAKRVEVLDVSSFMAHRAASYNEANMNDEEKAILNDQNQKLRKKLETKVDPEKWKEVTGVSIDDLFATDKRINVWLTANQMKQLGIVDKINKVTPIIAKEIAAATEVWAHSIAASIEEPIVKKENSNQTIMTIEKLKAEFPAVYAAIIEAGKQEGAKAEQERVKAWMHWVKTDPEKVNAALSSGAQLTMADISEMSAKAANAKAIAAVESDGSAAEATSTNGQEPSTKVATEKQKTLEEFEKNVNAQLGIPVK